MKTLVVDDYKRVRIPDLKPRQVFSYENNGGVVTLTPVKAVSDEPFPPGYDFGLTKERNRELLQLAGGSTLEVPK